MSLRDQLQSIYDSHGALTPELVVNEARAKTHPLHDRFEWNDKLAGEAYRRHQAHELIREAKVVYKKGTDTDAARSVRAFQAVRTPTGGYIYEPSERVADDPLLRAIVLAEMERDWQALKRRYAEFSEFLSMVREDVEETAA